MLWTKVREPLRAALMASTLCQMHAPMRRSKPLSNSQAEVLQEQADEYETWAIGLMTVAGMHGELRSIARVLPSTAAQHAARSLMWLQLR